MKKFIIEEDKLEAIKGYLQKKPYEEVAKGIYILSTLQEYMVEPNPDKKDAEPQEKKK
jgi:hypothetical protein